MKLVLGEEQEDLRDSVRRFLADRSPMARVREVIATPQGYDSALWERMASDLGLQGMAVPEAYGGAGSGQVERSVAMEELGRALVPSPFLGSAVLAADTLLAVDDDDARQELLPGIASGATIATVAMTDRGAPASATLEDGVWTLTGTKSPVLDGVGSDLLLVVARAGDEVGFFTVRPDAPGQRRLALTTLDLTRRLARVELAGTPARRLVCEDGAGVLARVMALASVALAAEQLGGLQRCLDMSVAYARARAQFGRAIGSFQAVKHLCAEMHVAMELARSAVRYAAWAADEAPEELLVAAALARACCSEAFFRVAADTIQVHGGIGFTWEHDAHLYYRRAKSSELLFGSPAQVREQLAVALEV